MKSETVEKVSGNYTLVPITEAIKPKDGPQWCYKDRYWAVKDECIMFFKGFAPQCNGDKKIAESINQRIHPDCETRFIPVIFRKADRGDF